MVAALDGPVGLVVAVPLARDADGLAAEVEAAFLNGYGARMVLAASALGLGVGIGAAMLFRRGDLARADGLRAMAGSVADDHALAKAMARIGLATRCASVPVWQAVGRRDMADVWTRHRRWAICRRMEEPLAFHAEPCLGAAMACLSAGIAAPALGVGPGAAVAATIATWILVEAGIAAAKGWPLTVAMPLALVIREAMMPAVWIAALCARSIAWGDRRLVLGPDRSGRRGLT
jgi:ceramide glucosyltransferase